MSKLSVILFLVVVACAAAGLLGGFQTVDVDDEGVVRAANHASKVISKVFSNKFHHRLVKVAKAKRQVVAGTNYKMDIILGMTNCKKQEVSYEEAVDCDIQDNVSAYKKCTILVYENLNGNHKLISHGCILASKKDL